MLTLYQALLWQMEIQQKTNRKYVLLSWSSRSSDRAVVCALVSLPMWRQFCLCLLNLLSLTHILSSFPYSPRHHGKDCLHQEKDIKKVKLERWKENVNGSELVFLFLFFKCLFTLRERKRLGEGQREREREGERHRERESQTGSVLSIHSPMQGLIPQTMRP